MERKEPTFVPEWLKKAGTVSGVLTSHADELTASDLTRNKSFVSSNGVSGGSFSPVKATSSYFHRSSNSNGSGHLRSCSSFGRNRQARDYDRDIYDSFDKKKLISGDCRRRDLSDVREKTPFRKFEGDGLHHSQSMVSGKHGDTWHKKVYIDSSTANNTSGLPSKGNPVGQASKVTFERDFPSLGAEERAVTSEDGRVPSPGLASASHSLPINSSAITGETLTSVLAQVPVLVGNSGTGMFLMQQVTPSSVMSVALGTPSNLNMAEAVAQGPKRVQNAPQLSVETQRLEELAIKQSRQLIPVTPPMPKTLVSSSLDKHKARMSQHQHPTSSLFGSNHSSHTNGLVKSDVSKPSNVGKLCVLKPVREKNGATPAVKDNLNLGSGGKLVSLSTFTGAPVSGSGPTCEAVNGPGHENKPALNLLEKRPSSQAQSRNDFFNSVRKKSMTNSSSVTDSSTCNLSSDTDTCPAISASASVLNNLAEMEVVSAPNTSRDGDGSHCVITSGNLSSEMICIMSDVNGARAVQKHVRNVDKLPTFDPIFPEEEEAAFLRSLGWEENADEGGLTEEEINAFFRDVAKYINSKSSLRIPQVAATPKSMSPFKPHIVGISGIPSRLSASDAKLES